MSLNFDKTVFMAFSIYTRQFPYDEIQITNNLFDTIGGFIRRVSRARYLGLIFDQSMKWHLHK